MTVLDLIHGKYILSLRVMIGCYFKPSDPDRFLINDLYFMIRVRYYECIFYTKLTVTYVV